jgi:DNA-binding CsgD family transcriptional regulator
MRKGGQLNATERRICQLVSKGYKDADIAEDLGLSVQYVKNTLAKIYRHVGKEHWVGLNRRVLLAIEVYKLNQ